MDDARCGRASATAPQYFDTLYSSDDEGALASSEDTGGMSPFFGAATQCLGGPARAGVPASVQRDTPPSLESDSDDPGLFTIATQVFARAGDLETA